MKHIYLDNAATTRMDDCVLDEMIPYLKDDFGNPSSQHRLGERASDAIEKAREIIARSVNSKPDQVIFTSGGTESCNIGMGMALAVHKKDPSKNTIIISPIEHPAVRESAMSLRQEGLDVIETGISSEGIVAAASFRPRRPGDICLTALMHVNNEIGTIQPVEEVAKVCQETDTPFFVDCVQSFLKLPLDFKRIGASGIAVSAHKIHGPKGVGAIIVSEDAPFKNMVFGGDQEFGKRAGTPSVANIVGFGAAVKLGFPLDEDKTKSIAILRDRLIDGLIDSIPCAILNGSREDRICNNVNVSFDGIEARALLEWLDERYISASAGSACSSRQLEPSRILTAVGFPPKRALGSVRFSLSKDTSREEIDATIDFVSQGVSILRQH
ncbi:MAG: cysteine desulfurase family protein [Nanoarchaeota archaeon]